MDQQKLIKQDIVSNKEPYDGFTELIKDESPVVVEPYFCLDSSIHIMNSDTNNKIPSGNFLYQCFQCDKHFVKKFDLDMHMRKHTGERPFACDACGKQFPLRGNLVKHQRIHNREKPYQWDVCDKIFTQIHTFVRHQRIHNKEK